MAREPITWKNIGIPNTNAASTLLNNAQGNLTGAMGTLNRFFEDQQKLQSQNRDRMVDLNTQEATNLLRQYQTVDGYQNALQSGDLDRQLAQFGPLVDQQRVNALRDSRLTDLRNTANAQYDYQQRLIEQTEAPLIQKARNFLAARDFGGFDEFMKREGSVIGDQSGLLNARRDGYLAFDKERKQKTGEEWFNDTLNRFNALRGQETEATNKYLADNGIKVVDGVPQYEGKSAEEIAAVQSGLEELSKQFNYGLFNKEARDQLGQLNLGADLHARLLQNLTGSLESAVTLPAYVESKRQGQLKQFEDEYQTNVADRTKQYEQAVAADPWLAEVPANASQEAGKILEPFLGKMPEITKDGDIRTPITRSGLLGLTKNDAPAMVKAMTQAISGDLISIPDEVNGKKIPIKFPPSIVKLAFLATREKGAQAFIDYLNAELSTPEGLQRALDGQNNREAFNAEYKKDLKTYEEIRNRGTRYIDGLYGINQGATGRAIDARNQFKLAQAREKESNNPGVSALESAAASVVNKPLSSEEQLAADEKVLNRQDAYLAAQQRPLNRIVQSIADLGELPTMVKQLDGSPPGEFERIDKILRNQNSKTIPEHLLDLPGAIQSLFIRAPDSKELEEVRKRQLDRIKKESSK